MFKKIISTNRKAKFLYDIKEEYEAGVVLMGNEVKSLRDGKMDLTDGYVKIENGQAYIYNITIPAYSFSSERKYNPKRPRKLLLHKQQIKRLIGKLTQRGLSLIPIQAYFLNNNVKLLLGLGKGRRLISKKQKIKERDIKRETEREMKQ